VLGIRRRSIEGSCPKLSFNREETIWDGPLPEPVYVFRESSILEKGVADLSLRPLAAHVGSKAFAEKRT
jgi:hypothetical protein